MGSMENPIAAGSDQEEALRAIYVSVGRGACRILLDPSCWLFKPCDGVENRYEVPVSFFVDEGDPSLMPLHPHHGEILVARFRRPRVKE
jgi:hypothetical protein